MKDSSLIQAHIHKKTHHSTVEACMLAAVRVHAVAMQARQTAAPVASPAVRQRPRAVCCRPPTASPPKRARQHRHYRQPTSATSDTSSDTAAFAMDSTACDKSTLSDECDTEFGAARLNLEPVDTCAFGGASLVGTSQVLRQILHCTWLPPCRQILWQRSPIQQTKLSTYGLWSPTG